MSKSEVSKLEINRAAALIAMGNDKFEVDDQLAGALLALLADLSVSDQAQLLCYILCEYGGRNVKPTSYPCEISKIKPEEFMMARGFLVPLFAKLESAFFTGRLSCQDFSRHILETLYTLKTEVSKRVFLAMVLSSHFTPFNYRAVEGAINEEIAGKILDANREQITAMVDLFQEKGTRFFSYQEQAKHFYEELRSMPDDVAMITLSLLMQEMAQRSKTTAYAIAIPKEALEQLLKAQQGQGLGEGLIFSGAKSARATVQ